ncbi:penicillin-binding protein 2 [Parendozoicomonas sp. Alg238-R29]|uniref:peptidoglycan D,D-transpeptidase FtsI family protein n=1 Tax=Parendozoicomonas sp. Alg238-R29 TaxID=2993446 RepID=UPI00248F4579|nr:penicillin-binding protein 2 [Parendozoicomonas sp. Alg238-R29]
MNKSKTAVPYMGRYRSVQVLMLLAVIAITGRVAFLHIWNGPFLQSEGDKRTLREDRIPAHRGIILDRNGSPLAVSTAVVSIVGNPRVLMGEKSRPRWQELSVVLDMPFSELKKRILRDRNKGFIYLKRQMEPDEAQKVLDLKISGVDDQPEYQRFYPAGEVTAQLVGLTDIDDKGQEGVELALDDWLAGMPGLMQVTKDLKGHAIRESDVLKSAEPGKEVKLSIDLRLQYVAYRELLKTVQENKAAGGSLVMLDVKTGEVLAMVNQPAFNPNKRDEMNISGVRNRAITDQFEPGSVIKPFAVAAALESGRYTSDSRVRVAPGRLRVGKDIVKDARDYGTLDLAGILAKSSNVGMTKMALDIGPNAVISLFQRVGFGQSTGVVFPGERTGLLPVRNKWRPIETATLSYGYGITVTALQLAQAYMVLANDGKAIPVSILKRDIPAESQQVISPDVARDVMGMMETVASKKGTARRARIDGYEVAGKTGTVKKLEAGEYSSDSYISLFAGIAPADDPRIVMVIMVDGARAGKYYGGVVAAPVFSRVASETMRVLGVPPETADERQTVADATRKIRNEG